MTTNGEPVGQQPATLPHRDTTPTGPWRHPTDLVPADRDARRRLEFLAEAGAVLGGSLDVDETLQQLADLVVPRLADWCVIDLVDEGCLLWPSAVAHADPQQVATVRALQGHYGYHDPHGPGRVARTGQPQLLEDVTDELVGFLAHDDDHLALMRALRPASAVAVPLVARGRCLGAITVVQSDSDRRLGTDDLAMLQDVAHRAATAVDNAARYTDRDRTARMLQQALLPPTLPDPPELEVAAAYDTADAADIGGDFYDVVATSQGWLITLGDVCGKGVEAAALSSLARHTVHAAASDPSPAGVLEQLNQTLLHQETDERFCTAVCAHLRVDTEPARMVVASGGHPPALIRRGDGGIEQVTADGLPLGLFADPLVTETQVDLQAGDLVLVYSDGLTEARRGHQLFGVEGLAAAAGSAARLSAEALVAHVHAAAERWQDVQRDDMAALAVEVQP